MRLFHFSEDSDIRRFEPLPPPPRIGRPPVVWAIDEEHAPHYYFPRNCPRICYWIGPGTTAADRERFFRETAAKRIIAIEFGWLDRVRKAAIWVYELPAETFVLEDDTAGYFASTEGVSPLRVEPLGDPLERLASSGVELRMTPSLGPLREALVPSTVPFSMIRLRNATRSPLRREGE